MNIEEAIDHFGSKTKIAEALGIHPSAVTQWGDVIPESRQYQLQVISGNKLKAVVKPAQMASDALARARSQVRASR